MANTKKFLRTLAYFGVILLQLVMTQVVTFVASLFFPSMGEFLQAHPYWFATFLAFTFGVGVFWAGWLAIRLRWLSLQPRHLARLGGALLGAFLPLIANLLIYHAFVEGSPVFWFSVLGSVLGFYALGWVDQKYPL